VSSASGGGGCIRLRRRRVARVGLRRAIVRSRAIVGAARRCGVTCAHPGRRAAAAAPTG
jgi:hypothetical protein